MSEIEPPHEDVPIAFRGTAEYRARLQGEALKRGIKVQGLLERAIQLYLESEVVLNSEQNEEKRSGQSDLVLASGLTALAGKTEKGDAFEEMSEARRHCHIALDVALDSDDDVTLKATLTNLRLFHKRTIEQRARDKRRKRRKFEESSQELGLPGPIDP